MARKPRAVVDTGILISGFVFGGLPKDAIFQVVEKTEIWASPDMLDEYRQVPLELEREGKITHEQLKILIAGVAAFVINAHLAHPVKSISICRDEKDNMILECCLACKADYLVTGDKDLLEIDLNNLRSVGFKKLKILNSQSFLSEIK